MFRREIEAAVDQKKTHIVITRKHFERVKNEVASSRYVCQIVHYRKGDSVFSLICLKANMKV